MIRSILFFMFWAWSKSGLVAQCADGEIAFSMNVYTDPWGYETYWELVPGTNACGDGTIIWGSNLEAVGCSGGGEQNSYGTATSYPSNTIVNVPSVCLTDGEYYTLYFVDDWGDGGLYFELFENGSFSGFYGGTGIGNSWTFQAGNSFLGPHDSPCNALEVIPGVNTSIEISNYNCYTQVAEVQPPQGNCLASGTWCADDVSRTTWAKFSVPDDGAYEISTVHNGTIINTQVAVWVSDDCFDMPSFEYVSGNDDFIGDNEVPFCFANPPLCVDQASAAYLNVIATYPDCCTSGWDDACQTLYDSMNTSCDGNLQFCDYMLEGYDTYGDGWNGCYITVTIDGISTDYTLTEGNYASWTLPVTSGSDVSIVFVAASYPEEVYVALKNADGVPLLFVQPVTVDPLLYDDVITCNGVVWFNPQASRCYTNCLEAGTTCYIQIDGYDNQTGQVVLTVKPYFEPAETNAIIADVICPVGVGAAPEGMIIPNITGWGVNYSSTWTGPNNFESSASILENIPPGEYLFLAQDNCGNTINQSYTVLGPEPFEFDYATTPTCPEDNFGSLSFSVSGGTEPYQFVWFHPDGSEHPEALQTNLSSGIYYLYLVDAIGCDVALPAEVVALPQPVFSLGEDAVVCPEFGMMLQGPSAIAYMWSTGSMDQDLIVSGNDYGVGEYDFVLTVTNEFGCSYTDSLGIEVIACIGVNDIDEKRLAVFPNPASDLFVITNLPNQCEKIRLYNVLGDLVLEENVMSRQQITVDASSLATGCYLLIVYGENEKYEQRINVIR